MGRDHVPEPVEVGVEVVLVGAVGDDLPGFRFHNPVFLNPGTDIKVDVLCLSARGDDLQDPVRDAIAFGIRHLPRRADHKIRTYRFFFQVDRDSLEDLAVCGYMPEGLLYGLCKSIQYLLVKRYVF